MRLYSKKGAGQTEYILIVVLIAITVMFSVSKYGKQVRLLFKKTNQKLTLMDGDSKNTGDRQDSQDSTLTGGEENPPAVDNSGEQRNEQQQPSNDNNEKKVDREKCTREYNALQNEKSREDRAYNTRISTYIRIRDNYQRLSDHYYSRARRSFWYVWSWWGGLRARPYWNSNLYNLAKRYQNLASEITEKIDAENERHSAFLENWNLKMEQWEKECGGNP